MTNKEKLLKLTSEDTSDTLAWAKKRQARKKYSLLSKKIAIRILSRLDFLGWKQIDLAKKMGVSGQQVSKWVKGNENFTIETLVNLSDALGVNLIKVTPNEDYFISSQQKLTMKTNYEMSAKIIRLPVSSKILAQETKYENELKALTL